MKILIIQERGRHEQNREFREALNFKRSLEKLKIPCTVWGLNYDNFSISFNQLEKDCDVILLLENYEKGNWIPDLSQSKKLKIFWSIDSHCNLSTHLKTCDLNKIDILLNSTSSYLNFFKKPGRVCHWFPNAYPSDLIYPIEGIEKNGVGFCGNLLNRQPYLDYLRDNVNIRFDNFVIGSNMVRTVNSYKIGWNRNLKDDINYRTFETPGCRTFLVTNETDRLRDLFEIDRHIVTYNSIESCVEKIKYYLQNDKERIEIEKSGYEHVKAYHTYDNRAQELLLILKKYL